MSNLSPENSGIFYGTRPHVAADGVQKATIKVRLRDYQNNPVAGRQAEIIADRQDVTIEQPGLTDSSGTATAFVSTETPGPVTITARVLPLE
jgi:hypothetical protein